MGKVICDICKKKCRGGVLRVADKYFHKDCFKCGKCNKSLESGGFFTKENNYYCPDDYNRHFSIKCRICREQIEGEVVSALGYSFHRHCFHCQSCRKSFVPGDRVTLWSERFYCKACVLRKQESEKENLSPGLGVSTDDEGRSSMIDGSGSSRPMSPISPLPGSSTHPLQLATDGGTTDQGYMSAESAIEKSKTMPVSYEPPPSSPCYSASSGDDSQLRQSRSRATRRGSGRQLEFGRFLNQSYLSLAQKTPVGEKDSYKRSTTPVRYPPPKSQSFHRPPTDNFSYRNTPIIRALRKGISLPTQSFSKIKTFSTPRSKSPAVSLNSEEPRRLALYPGAHEPDTSRPPPIDRYDWPAPAAPAVIWAEKMREKRLRSCDSASPDNLSLAVSEESRMDTGDGDVPDGRLSAVSQTSGMAKAILMEEKKRRVCSPTLDPVSASRAPAANEEPLLKPRYENHFLASPSRDTLRDRNEHHPLGYSLDYVNIGYRNSTAMPSSQSSLRPGYTQGMLTDPKTSSLQSSALQTGWVFGRRQSTELNGGMSAYSVSVVSVTGTMSMSETTEGTLDQPLDERGLRRTGLHRADRRTLRSTLRSVEEMGYPPPRAASIFFRRREPPPLKMVPYDDIKLTNPALPKGVDRTLLETYLSELDFQMVFNMSRQSFYHLPEWKRNDLKRRVHLF